jgi:TIR domain
MVSNLVPRQVLGVGAETGFIESHLLDKNGRVRDLDEIRRDSGGTIAQFAYLDYELGRHLRQPMARGYPPRIFFSYRRETSEHVRWCKDLAGELHNAGYGVMLDALAIQEEDPSMETIARFVGQLATADVALVVVTPSYVGTEREMRQWMFEEWSRIEILRTVGLLEVVGVIRAGDFRNSMARFNPALDALIDLSGRNQADRRPVLDFFGEYRGPRIREADELLLAQNANACITASQQRDETKAATHLSRLQPFKETEEFRVADVSYNAFFRPQGRAIQLAEEARGKNLTFSALAEMAHGLWAADLDDYAFRPMAEIAQFPSWWRGFFHLIMGETLERRGFLHSALNHLSWCVTVQLEGTLEQFGALPDELLDQARDDIRTIQRIMAKGPAALPATAERRLPEPDKRCDVCGARYSSAGSACALCGTLHGHGVANCEMCGYDVVSWRKLIFCPVCRSGFFKSVQGRRVEHVVLPRTPGGPYSVLWPYANPTPGSKTV